MQGSRSLAPHDRAPGGGRHAPPPDELFQHPLFRDTEPGRFRHLLPSIAVWQAEPGTLLHEPEAPSELLHLVLRGRLRAYQPGPGGRRLVLDLIEAGGFDGILPVAGHRGHVTEVVEHATLASLELNILECLVVADRHLASNLLRLITTRLERREQHLETIALYEPTARLVRQFLALGDAFGETEDRWTVIRQRLTHQLLADMLGVRRETVTLHIRQLVRLGAVTVHDGCYRLDRSLLQTMARTITCAEADETPPGPPDTSSTPGL